MVFVNEIAEITHGCSDEFLGQSNKNIGDCFLMVWKYNQDWYIKSDDGNIELKKDKIIEK